MIDYKKDVNKVNLVKVAKIATSILVENCTKDITRRFYACLETIDAECCSNLTVENLKDIKTRAKQEVSDYINNYKYSYHYIMPIAECTSITYIERLNLAMTIARWPEFFLRSDSEMQMINKHKKDYIKDIKPLALTKEYVYSDNIDCNDLNIYETLRNQKVAIMMFLQHNAIHADNDLVDRVIQELKDIQLLRGGKNPFEEGFFNSVFYIRKHIKEVENRMWDIINGSAKADDFSRSESRSILSSYPDIVYVLRTKGYKCVNGKIPAVLANAFHMSYPTIGLSAQAGQIDTKINGEYAEVAFALGPGLKLRVVYNISVEIQNTLEPLASLIKKSDSLYDPNEAYIDQLTTFLDNIPYAVDSIAIDATGYSDYLFRGIYSYLLRLYGCSEKTVEYIMSVFRLGIRIDGEIYQNVYGALQGVKLLVFIMNHANRLMGIIASRISGDIPIVRPNAGDDVNGLYDHIVTDNTIETEMAVFACFNSPTNKMKTEWLYRDGYTSFCSKYFAFSKDNNLVGISGIPPKILGKEMLCIKNFSEVFKVLHLARVSCKKALDSFNELKDVLIPWWEEGMKLENLFESDMTLNEKIAAARDIPIELGGLAEDSDVSVERMLYHASTLLDNILKNYHFEVVGVFLFANMCIPPDTELFKALATIQREGMAKYIETASIIKQAKDGEEVDLDLLSKAVKNISRFEQSIIKGNSFSSSSSTYHRTTLSKNIDIFYKNVSLDVLDDLVVPSTLFDYATLAGVLADDRYSEMDNIKNYMHISKLLANHEGCIIKYYGVGNEPYVAIKDSDGNKIRLSSYHSNYKLGHGFKHPEAIIDPEIKELYYCLINSNSIQFYKSICDLQYDMLVQTIADIAKHTMSEVMSSTMKRVTADMLKHLF